jgi:hypothetical protein
MHHYHQHHHHQQNPNSLHQSRIPIHHNPHIPHPPHVTKESSLSLPLSNKLAKGNSSSNSSTVNSKSSVKPSTSYKCLKYFVFSYLVLILVSEIAWAAYSTAGLKKDLQAEVDAGELDQTYMREFYKSTKNFFMFNLILIFLSICIGCAAVGTENKQLLLAFMIIFGIEWIFEVIGVYNSGDKNVVIYRMIPAILRPGLIVSSIMFMRFMSKAQHLKTLNSLEEGSNEERSSIPVHQQQASTMNGNISNRGLASYVNHGSSPEVDENSGRLRHQQSNNQNNHDVMEGTHAVRISVGQS